MYVDPSAGSLIVQVAAATALSGLAFLARFRVAMRERLATVFRRRKAR